MGEQFCLQELELPEWGSLSGQSYSFQVPVMGRRCFQQPIGMTEAHRAQHWEHQQARGNNAACSVQSACLVECLSHELTPRRTSHAS